MVTPADTAVTTPVAEPIVAIAGLLLLHTPPGVGLVSTIVLPAHKLQPVVGHTIGSGDGLMVMVTLPVMVELHPKILVATTVYTQGPVCKPKLIAAPVPATGNPTGLAPQYNW